MTSNFDLKTSRSVLAATPVILESWLLPLPGAWVNVPGGDEDWSAFDIVGHLVHGERTDWIPRAQQILEGRGDTPFHDFDRFAQFRESQGKTLRDLLTEFSELRAQSLQTLDSFELDDAKLALGGLHPDFGPVHLKQLLATWTVHDLTHISQIGRTLSKHYHDEVGPWRAYLPILDR